jgi:putative peptide zinc metalloprotease protein
VLIAVLYPFVKALHELGHGYAVKKWGGEVREMGIMLLVLMPMPYVDASSSLAFRSKWQRAFVSGAGIMVELGLAALALIVWVNVEDGITRAIMFNVMLIGGISTLIFNGNPLLRFDGYYVLCDIIEIPNLATRANRYFISLIQRWLLDIEVREREAVSVAERAWFIAYAMAAFVYRLFIMVTIALFVATKFFSRRQNDRGCGRRPDRRDLPGAAAARDSRRRRRLVT